MKKVGTKALWKVVEAIPCLKQVEQCPVIVAHTFLLQGSSLIPKTSTDTIPQPSNEFNHFSAQLSYFQEGFLNSASSI